MSTIAVNSYHPLGSGPKPHTRSVHKAPCLPSNYIWNLTTSHQLPLTPSPKPHPILTTDCSESLRFSLLPCLPPYFHFPRPTFHTAPKAIFENNKSDCGTPLLQTCHGFPLSAVKFQLLTSAPKLHLARPLLFSRVFSNHLTLSQSCLLFQGLCTCCLPAPEGISPECCLVCSLDSSLNTNVTKKRPS